MCGRNTPGGLPQREPQGGLLPDSLKAKPSNHAEILPLPAISAHRTLWLGRYDAVHPP